MSAYGIGHARLERMVIQQVLKPLYDIENLLNSKIKNAENEAIKLLKDEGLYSEDIEISKRFFYLRFSGQDSTLEIEIYKLIKHMNTISFMLNHILK